MGPCEHPPPLVPTLLASLVCRDVQQESIIWLLIPHDVGLCIPLGDFNPLCLWGGRGVAECAVNPFALPWQHLLGVF